MKTFLKFLAVGVCVLLLVGGGGLVWASSTSTKLLGRTFEVHSVDFPIPVPLGDAEVAARELSPDDAVALAREQAVERGRHLVETRYGCTECHGLDFGGATMVNAPAVGVFLGPNLTLGEGSVTREYAAADWDRIVRHGVRPDGTPAVMPSVDFVRMSDQELSDIVSYIRSLPPVDRTMDARRLGPVGKVLLATGKMPIPADGIGSHTAPHAAEPPGAAVTPEFGAHLATTCVGCHGPLLAGGPIVGGDPSWPAATNLTPHAEGLQGWTRDDFARLVAEGVRPDGTAVQLPMTFTLPFLQRMTETELDAIWLHLQSLDPVATGTRE